MKARKILTLAMVLAMVFTFSAIASAADTWQVCTISETGFVAQNGTAYVKLTLATGAAWEGARWFVATPDHAKSILAVALTAIAAGDQVNAWLGGTGEWAVVKGLFCRAHP